MPLESPPQWIGSQAREVVGRSLVGVAGEFKHVERWPERKKISFDFRVFSLPCSQIISDSRHSNWEMDALVFDCGSGVTKAGFAGDDAPRSVFPTTKFSSAGSSSTTCDSAPIQYGVVTDWDSMEQLYRGALHELDLDPREFYVMMTEAPMTPSTSREKLTELLFETFQHPGLSMQSSAVLALRSTGRHSGIVVDVGAHNSYAVPVAHNTYTMKHAITRCLPDKPRRMLDKHCLPDGTPLVESSSSLHCLNTLFQSSSSLSSSPSSPHGGGGLGRHSLVIPEGIADCFRRLEPELQDEVLGPYGGILLFGGTTFLDGFKERVAQDALPLIGPKLPSTVVKAAPERKYSAWIGGSIDATITNFEQKVVTKAEYEENGSNFVHQRWHQ